MANKLFTKLFLSENGKLREHNIVKTRPRRKKSNVKVLYDFPLVKEDCVRDRLSDLDVHKSMGSDGMHPRVLRELADVIAEPLSIIFERSWRTGEVPEDWRRASVTPIFKKGKKEDPGIHQGEIMLDQSDSFLRWHDQLGR